MGDRVLTTVAGSYPQPDWLVDKTLLERNSVPRRLSDGNDTQLQPAV